MHSLEDSDAPIWQNFGILQLEDPSFMKSFDVRGVERGIELTLLKKPFMNIITMDNLLAHKLKTTNRNIPKFSYKCAAWK